MRLNCFNFATFTICLCFLASTIHALDKVRLNKDGQFVDSKGRVLLFHGFNSVKKSPPWYDFQMTNLTQLRLFRSWGINVVRLGIMWSGLMPTKGQVDEKYLRHMEDIVDRCHDHGIYVLLDMHQDVLSSRFGTYDGIPQWLIDELPKPSAGYDYPWPYSKPPKNWFENYLTLACVQCAEQLYTNVSGTWNYWADFWVTVAKRFREKSNVIGYELMNEPPMGNFYENPAKLLPGYVGSRYLLPTYDYLVRQIRSVDTDTLIFYEPLTYGVFMPNSILDTGTGFSHVPDALIDPHAVDKSVLSYHYYCWLLQTTDPRTHMPWWKKFLCDRILMPEVFANSRRSRDRTGGGRFLTEFGLCGPDGNPHSINTIECDTVMLKADKEFQSWTYWDGNFLDELGNPIETQVKFFVRPYPMLTQGSPDSFYFDPKTGEFYYSFNLHTSNIPANKIIAQIFVPNSIQYPKGVSIEITPHTIKSIMHADQLRLMANISEMEGERVKVIVRMRRL